MRFKIKAYTGQALTFPWWGQLVFDISGMRLDPRFPVLREHDSMKPAGTGTKSWKADGALWAQGVLLSNRHGEEIQKLMEEDFPLQASVGIWPITVEEVKKSETVSVNGRSFTGPGTVWRESHVREISIVVLGADDKTEVLGLAASAGMAGGTLRLPTFEAVVAGLRASGLSVTDSLREVARKYPQLHQAYLARKNREWREGHGSR